MDEYIPFLPHVNATLNAIATCLLLLGYRLIRRQHETAHKWTMLTCFGVSVLFLVTYLIYHIAIEGSKHFPDDAPGAVRLFYFFILITHIVLAAVLPFLAMITIYLGLAMKRRAHLRLARWTFPIWVYVSVTGVIVYVMLYHLFAPQG